ncbi:MAG: hypothetical protein AAF619_03350 [Pseudomonadota bacterium]
MTDGFFIGWANSVPRGLRLFLVLVSAVMIGAAGGLALAIGSTVDDPGNGAFRFDLGRQEVAGVLVAKPYPYLRVPAGADRTESQAILLSGQGKRGVQGRAEPLDGQVVEVSGVLLTRGTVDMIQVGGPIGLRASEDEVEPSAASYEPSSPTPLGKWRLTGEICDGKCYQGAMRPGTGLSHKACANLCIIGGAPPVFVSTAAVDGETFFLMGEPDDAPLSEWYQDYTGQLVTIEGDVRRVDDLLIFSIDPDSVDAL